MSTNEKEIEKAERWLREKAERERKAHLSTREYAIELAGEFRKEMIEAYSLTLQSVQTVVRTTDGKGNIHTSIYNGGLSSASPPEGGSLVIKSNIRSRRERADRISRIISELDQIIDRLKRGDPTPGNIKAHFAALKESIPDRNELELYGKPQSGKDLRR
jgi:hypothetical protein